MRDFIENWIDDKKKYQNSDSTEKVVRVSDLPALIELIEKENSYVGIKDIDGNKIYADFSIVEFKFYSDFLVTGWFHFNHKILRYEILLIKAESDNYKLDSIHSSMYYDENTMTDFKIKETLQEDEHLLEKTDV